MPATVPVEHRALGLDRRTIAPAVVIAAIVIFYSMIIPYVDGLVDHDSAVEPGTSLVIGGNVSIVPPAGWEVTDRTALDAGSLELHNSGIIVNANVGPFAGELDDLLAYADGIVDGTETGVAHHEASSIVAADGTAGLEEHWDGVNTEGLVAVFSDGTVGVVIAVEGPAPMVTRHQRELDQMIASVRFGADS